MSEVYTGLECVIKRVGSASGDSTETAIDAYAEGVTITVSRELTPRTDTQGVVQDRVPVATSAEMSISKLFSDDPFLFDGNNIKIYLNDGGATGSAVYQMDNCWWQSKGYSGDAQGPMRYDVSVVGDNFAAV